ncbi:thiol:disulfide interchange protein DsbC [Pseudoxanthomonas sp. 3HH-4]|uniref:DsbC family protein n=1 Tax=Pseudoxanthomonas sp. 3HH-4 TaxID=1690214 RepID=UPI00114E5EF0|nr:DsbC family protein [Pseudoxanthomonas sp. 3HH-4]TQM17452.1 thiol:disulfide interchange protein DsbC [Pseudoxanthomonas sp. 3HH-4]
MPRLMTAALLGALSLTACAQAPQPPAQGDAAAATPQAAVRQIKAGVGATPDERARSAIAQLNPQAKVEYVGAAPLPGFREVIAGGQLLYISDDGRYLMQGTVLDLDQQQDLMQTSPALAGYRSKLIATIPHAERIVFAPPNAKYTVTVFTDIECGYCRKLHGEVGELNRLGIAVEYLAFPRMGLGSQDHKDMISVWCAPDRKRALTDAKAGKSIPPRDCKNPVTMEFDVGQRIGVSGTPAIYSAEGVQLGGYLPPAALRAKLDELAAKKAPAAAAGAAP